MAYKAPIWEDGKSPAISAENLNNLSQAAEGAQVLYGNSAPTSSTEGAVGQFYLVVVADSDGNYPLYQCVAIANGSYTWRDTRRIPDSITSMLGIPTPGTINRALNVLANIGNLHVWERVQTYSEPVPAWSELVDETADRSDVSVATINNALIYLGDGKPSSAYISYSSSITVVDTGAVTLNDPSQTSVTSSISTKIKGKYIKLFYKEGYGPVNLNQNKTYYVPDDASVTLYSGNDGWVICDKLKRVDGHPTIPAGTTIDYLTSTDRNAYTEGTVDSTTITYLGQLGGGARIEVCSYVGTGTYENSNPCSVTADFPIKVLLVVGLSMQATYNFAMVASQLTERYAKDKGFIVNVNSGYGNYGKKSSDGKTFYWYNAKMASAGLNESGVTYTFIAIG